MAIAEPDGALWSQVVSRVPDLWPEDNEDTVRFLGESWRRGVDLASQTMGDMHAVGADLAASWRDTAGDSATGAVTLARQRIGALGNDMGLVAAEADRYAAVLTGVKTAIAAAIAMNEVTYAQLGAPVFGALGAAAQAVFAARVASRLDSMVNEQAAALSSGGLTLATPALAANPTAGPPAPPPGATPEQNKAWWDSLTPAQREAVIRENPGLIGNRNGVPAADRDRANRIVLDREIARLTDERARLDRAYDEVPLGPQHASRRVELLRQMEAVDDALGEPGDEPTGLHALKSKLDESAHLPENQRHYLIGLDTSGDGTAILAKGNPDTAANVTTFVPGVTSEMSTVHRTIGGPGNPGWTGHMFNAANRYAPDGQPNTAVVTWFGYDSPDSILPPDSVTPGAAQAGAPLLTDFQQGLRATHVGEPSFNTIVGHSYGSAVTGHAAQNGGLAADRLVFVGSPGVGAENVGELNIDPKQVYASAPPADVVAHAANPPLYDPFLGPDPTDEEFGAQSYEAEWHVGHEGYWEPSAPRSLDNLGRLMTGQAPH